AGPQAPGSGGVTRFTLAVAELQRLCPGLSTADAIEALAAEAPGLYDEHRVALAKQSEGSPVEYLRV
ncbi:MAG: hypothetical protein ACO1SX_13900, partial [Actinomycetota bacterium]